jgi:hypothetical protein
MTRRPLLRSILFGIGLMLTLVAAAQEPIDNCASLLGSLSVELRYARNLSSDVRTTFVCPRDTKALLGASKQRIVNSLGPPDVTGAADHDGTSSSWSYFFGPRPEATYPPGVPELRFEFDGQQKVATVSCQRTR